jgi:phospholipase C
VSRKKRRRWIAGGLAVGLAAAIFGLTSAFADPGSSPSPGEPTMTPIKHLVVIFQENESFDHYFGTYPNAANLPDEPTFTAKSDTPGVNGLNPALLDANPNPYNPKRLSRFEALTCDMNHGYTAEQQAYDHGLVDRFPQYTSSAGCEPGQVMDYFDGNTVTGLWNLAQHFALNDNSFDTQFGPSTPGALNLISGETGGAEPANLKETTENGTDIGDADPYWDKCGKQILKMTGKNIGNVLNEHGITWGWFQGGFTPSGGTATAPECNARHKNIGNAEEVDYSPHHNPFEYYQSTANPLHLAPESEAMIGRSEPGAPENGAPGEHGANHEYDVSNFDEAIKHENLPAVSFIKAPEYQDGHPGYSDPLDEQTFIAEKLDELEHSGQWESTAVVIAYDDSDGWYDHVMPPIVNQSESASDDLTNPGQCRGLSKAEEEAKAKAESEGKAYKPTPLVTAVDDRCGYGPRLPLMVISPYAKQNYVDSTLTDQSSIIKFVEENWQTGEVSANSMANVAGTLRNMFDFEAGAPTASKVFLDPTDGEIIGEEGGSEGSSGDEGGQGGSGGDGGSGGGSGSHGGHNHHEKVHCKVDGHSHHVELNCSVKGGKGRGAVRFRIERGHKVFGTSRASIKGTKADATVNTRHSLAGRYTLLATVSRTDGIDALAQSVSLPGTGSVDLH